MADLPPAVAPAAGPQVRDVTFFYEQALQNDASESRFSGEESAAAARAPSGIP